MNQTRLSKQLKKLTNPADPDTFIYDLLRAYKLPKATVTRLQSGERNESTVPGEVSLKRQLLFREIDADTDPEVALATARAGLSHRQRFVVITDYTDLLAYDTKTEETLDIPLAELHHHYDFFLPWAGIEKQRHIDENPADVKAAERMAHLFDLIKRENPDDSPQFAHDLNVFLSRLLFCYFAEDTGIFPGTNMFSNGIGSQTQSDGSDLQNYFLLLFETLDTPEDRRDHLRAHFNKYRYVNGGLFQHLISVPTFSARSRRAIIEAGKLDWKDINPDIFGSMIQAVVDKDKRGGLGMHYTSVPNIMKVIEPLFLNDLRETFEKARGSRYRKHELTELRKRLGKLKIFDPACGSGNFLIIAYKQLRLLEMDIVKELQSGGAAGEELFEKGAGAVTTITLDQFYGIEIDDFAHEIAILALWLAEHQMNVQYEAQFGVSKPTLPLTEAGHIVQGNACRLDWEEVCPKEKGDETYILGNPPYQGARKQNSQQKSDLLYAFKNRKNVKNLDYISIWFYKASSYIDKGQHRFAFVSTDSICQGQQVSLLWPALFDLKVEIYFAYTSFKWRNNAREKAGVSVVIIGLLHNSQQVATKLIFESTKIKEATNINAYLIDAEDIIVDSRRKPLAAFPKMSFGNMPNDGGGLILTESQYKIAFDNNPGINKYIKRLYGSDEFINGTVRYCYWIEDDDAKDAVRIISIKQAVEVTKNHRLNSKDKGTKKLAERSHQFRDTKTSKISSLIIPSVSSERRKYIPMGFIGSNSIVSNLALVVYDAPFYILAVLQSHIHDNWTRTIGGKLETRIRYSKDICYNTFPFPSISVQQKSHLTLTAQNILLARERHPSKTLAELYDPDKMPNNLREAHRINDEAVEACYRDEPFESDEERLEYLFKLYERMIEEERQRETLFAAQKKEKRKRKAKKT